MVHAESNSHIQTQDGDHHETVLTAAANEAGANSSEECKTNAEGSLSASRAYFRLWTYANPLDMILRLIATAAALGGGSAYPLMAIIFGNLVNAFNNTGLGASSSSEFRSRVNHQSLWFLYLFIGKFALLYIADLLYNFTATRIARRIRLRYLDNVLHQPISYFDSNTSGSISMSLSTDTDIIQVGLGDKVASVFQACGMIIAGFAIAFTESWKMTLVVGTILPYAIAVTLILGSFDSRLEGKRKEVYSKASSVAEEALSSSTNITALCARDKIVKKFKHILAGASRYAIRQGPIQASIYGNMFFSMQSGYALALYYGAQLVFRKEISEGGTVITVLFCMIMASSAMGIIAPSIPSFLKAAVSAQQVLQLLQQNPTTGVSDDQGLKPDPERIRGHLRFEKVTFSYPTRSTIKVLDGLSLNIAAGKVTAVVGQSGSGKTTMIGLLERWYNPATGSIYLDGVDIRSLDLGWLRGQIGLVQQDPTLFNDTIMENVLNGLCGGRVEHLGENKRRELVINACKQANAHEFIEALPQGYETVIGQGGDLLSGGQKQRIAIARTIISNPKVLLLDEPTSALDPESERAVLASLERASQGRTTIMIAHRLSTVERADRIVVMDKGRVIEEGTHASLLAQGGAYCRLLHTQGHETPKEGTRISVGDNKPQQILPEKVQTDLTLPGMDQCMDAYPFLGSKSISRKSSIIQCIFTILSKSRSILPAVAGGTIGACVAGAAIPVQSYLFSKLITVFQLQGERLIDRGNFWAVMFFTLALTNLVSYAVLWFLFAIAGTTISRNYRAEYLRGMLGEDTSFFEVQGNSSGALASLLSGDGEDLEMMFSMSLALIMVFFIDIISCCILAIAICWKLGLLGVLGCYPVLFLAGYFRIRMDTTAQDRCASSFLESARFSSEAVGAIRTISSLSLESKIIERYEHRLQKAFIKSTRRMFVSMVFFALSDCMDFLAIALVFWYGSKLVSYGEVSVGAFFIVYTAIIFGGQGAGFIFGYTTSITKFHAAANRMLFMVNRKPTINSSSGIDPHTAAQADVIIEFRRVGFRYPTRPEAQVLKGLDLRVHRGEKVGLVGPSGSGKSTIISLVERFYDITAGELLIYCNPISSLDIQGLRSLLSLVPQETNLYQGTIRENLCLGVDEVDETILFQACRDANIHDFIISLPEGYNTDCGPRGLSLSGGQRQRIAIARALLRNPEILLLDEATSALDPESQALVSSALENAAKGRTVVSVTHSAEIMKQMDRVFVIEYGIVVEDGTYEELLNRRGRFWEMQRELMMDG